MKEMGSTDRQTDRQKETERQTFFTSFAKEFGRRKGMLTTNLKTWGFTGLCLLCLRCAFSCVPIAASVRHDKYPIVKRTDNGVRFPLPLHKKLPTHLLQGGHHLKKFFWSFSHVPACLPEVWITPRLHCNDELTVTQFQLQHKIWCLLRK